MTSGPKLCHEGFPGAELNGLAEGQWTLTQPASHRSNYSGSNSDDCVEAASRPGSSHRTGHPGPERPQLTIQPPTWRANSPAGSRGRRSIWSIKPKGSFDSPGAPFQSIIILNIETELFRHATLRMT